MKKFKIIEESRFVTRDEMGNIKGGFISSTCTTIKGHSSCFLAAWITCGPAAVSGYGSQTCVGSSGGLKNYETCGLDVKYQCTTCAGLSWFSTNCGIGSGIIYA